MKRWVWKEKSRRDAAKPSRWQIDDEYDVQSLLWTVLYPIYREQLVDETYVAHWGNVQARVDLGIVKLKLIIEVKIARVPSTLTRLKKRSLVTWAFISKTTHILLACLSSSTMIQILIIQKSMMVCVMHLCSESTLKM